MEGGGEPGVSRQKPGPRWTWITPKRENRGRWQRTPAGKFFSKPGKPSGIFITVKRFMPVLAEAQKAMEVLNQLLKSRELTGQWLSMKTVRAQLEIANATNDLFTSSQALEVSKVNF